MDSLSTQTNDKRDVARNEVDLSQSRSDPGSFEAAVRGFVSKLAKAKKDLGFYPRGNPAIQAAMGQCEASQAEVIGNDGPLTLLISKDQFYLRDQPLFPPQTPESRFAAHLFTLGLRRISFTGKAQASDFEQLMNLLLEIGDDPGLFSAALGGFPDQAITGIELYQIADLEVVDESALAEEIDLALERLQDEGQSSTTIAKVAQDIYVRILPGTLEPTRIAKLLENPSRIKEAFDQLALPRENAAARTVAMEVAARVLSDVAHTIAKAPPTEQTRLFRATAELLLDVEEPMRTAVLIEKILPQATSDNHLGTLIHSLTDEELIELLTTRVPLHEGVVGVISTSICSLGLPFPRRVSLLHLLRKRAAQAGPEDRRYAELFKALSGGAGTDGAADADASEAELGTRPLTVPQESLQLTDDERFGLDETLQRSGSMPDIENIPVLIDLLHIEEDVQRYRDLIETVETLRKEALNRGRTDAAIEVVRGYAALRQDSGLQTERWEMLEKAWESAADAETITSLAQLSLQYEKGSSHYSLILEYLRTVLDRGYRVLLERLEKEESKPARLAIRGLLIALGTVNVDALRERVVHKQWFVARNVVSILGEIGGEGAVEALAAALGHDEPRVRHEALNALGKIGGESAARVIGQALGDRDNTVAVCAARWLTTMGSSVPLGRLAAIVHSGRFRRADPEIVMLAIKALGHTNNPKALDLLKKMARKRIGSLFGTRRRITACAADALRMKTTRNREHSEPAGAASKVS
jgi:hypothetical protein